jgi:hypothetical protein
VRSNHESFFGFPAIRFGFLLLRQPGGPPQSLSRPTGLLRIAGEPLEHPSEANGGVLECLMAVCLLHDSAVDFIGDLHTKDLQKASKDAQEALRQVKDIQAFCDPYPPGAFEEAVDNLMPGSKDGLMETYWRVSSLGGDQCTQKAIDLIPAIQSLLSAFQSQDNEAFLRELDAFLVPAGVAMSSCLKQTPDFFPLL